MKNLIAALAFLSLSAGAATAQIQSMSAFPGGTNGQIQYNNSGRFGGIPSISSVTLSNLSVSTSALRTDLDAEILLRKSTDTALSAAIDAETLLRKSTDTALSASIALKVAKAGDTMTGRLTVPDLTATYGVSAATVSVPGTVITSTTAVFNGGNVGIGTASPGSKLDVVGPVNTPAIHIKPAGDETSTSTTSIRISGDSTASGRYVEVQSVNNGGVNVNQMAFVTCHGGTCSEKMRLNSSDAKLGIGTSSMDANLHVVGTSSITGNSFFSGNAFFALDVSALTFTDRTPFPESVEQAYRAVKSMRRKATGGVDHDALDPFIHAAPRRVYKDVKVKRTKTVKGERVTETVVEKSTTSYTMVPTQGRDLSATVSAQNEVIKDLIRRIELMEMDVAGLRITCEAK